VLQALNSPLYVIRAINFVISSESKGDVISSPPLACRQDAVIGYIVATMSLKCPVMNKADVGFYFSKFTDLEWCTEVEKGTQRAGVAFRFKNVEYHRHMLQYHHFLQDNEIRLTPLTEKHEICSI